MTASEIFKGLSFDDATEELINSRLQQLEIGKGDVLLKPDDIVQYQYYVAEGCLRSFFIDHTAKEHTIQFAISDWWISDYTAFYKQERAILYIECIQKATLFRLSRKDMIEILNLRSDVERFFHFKTESYISSFQKRILGDLSKTAKERYTDFVRHYPNIEQSVKNYHIASYLGITSESLSRIRKELLEKN
ncbi:MAG: Crp/Fnr family transcriptional regulator [Bacteroidota bacterium]